MADIPNLTVLLNWPTPVARPNADLLPSEGSFSSASSGGSLPLLITGTFLLAAGPGTARC
ncbi:hypothetical protein MUNTM_49520 [Mycobacterium sp. MUNTM1]